MGIQSILRRLVRRKLTGICWYLAKSTGHTVKQGGTADSARHVHSPLTEIELSRAFLFPLEQEGGQK